MSKNTSLILAVASLVILFAFVYLIFPRFFNDEQGTASITIDDKILEVLVADEHDEQVRGLSDIGQDELLFDGMLFVFEDSQERVFWMKDMNFPLDIIWTADNQIVKIEENVEVFDELGEVRRMYSEPFGVDMVLELPAGSVKQTGIVIGQGLEIH